MTELMMTERIFHATSRHCEEAQPTRQSSSFSINSGAGENGCDTPSHQVYIVQTGLDRHCLRPRDDETGFTLLEMVLVLFLIALMASAAMLMTEGVEDQAKYDETKRRMELISKAIVGDPTRTVNGSPEVSGFVADMGRLPNDLNELLEQGALSPWSVVAISIPSSGLDINGELQGGWRGPYLQVAPDSDGTRRFRDGYGNEFAFLTEVVSGVSAVKAQSLGADGVPGTIDDYPYPASAVAVSFADFIAATSSVDAFTIDFVKQAASTINLTLELFYWTEAASPAQASCPFTLAASQVQANVTVCDNLPYGRVAAAIRCDDASDYVYDGDCTGNTLHEAPFYMTLVPRRQLPTIRWATQ